MTQQSNSVEFAPEFEERIGALLDRVSGAGYPEIHGALATFVRERRGRVRAGAWPRGVARELERFTVELEELVSWLESRS